MKICDIHFQDLISIILLMCFSCFFFDYMVNWFAMTVECSHLVIIHVTIVANVKHRIWHILPTKVIGNWSTVINIWVIVYNNFFFLYMPCNTMYTISCYFTYLLVLRDNNKEWFIKYILLNIYLIRNIWLAW